ncbi:hypothetical protein ACO0LH_03020 [Undibacterium sp. TJN19]
MALFKIRDRQTHKVGKYARRPLQADVHNSAHQKPAAREAYGILGDHQQRKTKHQHDQ